MDPFLFDRLPYLAMENVFKYLSTRDLVRCRAVCRHFKLFLDQFGVKKLIISDFQYVGAEYWYLTTKPIDYKDAIRCKALSALKPAQFKPIQQLKFLHVRLNRLTDFSVLNRFKQLVHLEIHFADKNHHQKRSLILPELRVLKLHSLFQNTFILKTPKLHALKYGS